MSAAKRPASWPTRWSSADICCAPQSATIEAELRATVGDRAVDGLRRALLAFVQREGAIEEVRALRSRAVF